MAVRAERAGIATNVVCTEVLQVNLRSWHGYGNAESSAYRVYTGTGSAERGGQQAICCATA